MQHRTINEHQPALSLHFNLVMVCRKLTRVHRIRFAICKWTRRGHTHLASLEQSYVPDLIICMDVHPNPGWESANSATRTPLFPAKRTPYANEAVISGVTTLRKQHFHHRLPVVSRMQLIHPLLYHQYKLNPAPHRSRKGMYRRSRAGKRVQEKNKDQNKSKLQVLVTHRRQRAKSIVHGNRSNSIVVCKNTKRSNNQNKTPTHNRRNPLNLVDVNITKPSQCCSSLIRFATWNVQSLNKKSADICDLIISNHLDILAVTETWLSEIDYQNNNSVAEILNTLKDFAFYHVPRVNRAGGGIGVFLRKGFSVSRNDTPLFSSMECMDLSISHGNSSIR